MEPIIQCLADWPFYTFMAAILLVALAALIAGLVLIRRDMRYERDIWHE